jgi:hypothetical protein
MPGLDDDTGYLFPFALWTYGPVEIEFQSMVNFPQAPFEEEGMRRELQRRLNELPDISIPDERLEKRPSFPLLALGRPGSLRSFFRDHGMGIRGSPEGTRLRLRASNQTWCGCLLCSFPEELSFINFWSRGRPRLPGSAERDLRRGRHQLVRDAGRFDRRDLRQGRQNEEVGPVLEGILHRLTRIEAALRERE